MIKKIVSLSVFFSLSVFLFSSDIAKDAFIDGCSSFSRGDWPSAIFSLKKAASYESNNNPETYYMLINAEIYAENFENALDDCELYLDAFPNSLYESNVMYLKGRCLFAVGEYDKAVIVLSDFCHQYENHDMYASSLFWIAECFYACYQHNDAVSVYQRIVTDFPTDAKAPAAQYRIETINQRDREEKLLYLLKQTGEEYLYAKEEYEKQMKYSSPESMAAKKRQMELEEEKKAAEDEMKYMIRELKQKAAETKILYDYLNDTKELGGEE